MTRFAKLDGDTVDLIYEGPVPPFFEREVTYDANGNPILSDRLTEAGWEPVPDGVGPGWTKEPGGTFTAPPAPPPPSPAEREEEAQRDFRALTEDADLFVALGLAMVRLVQFTAKNVTTVANADEAVVFNRLKTEVLAILRDRKGV